MGSPIDGVYKVTYDIFRSHAGCRKLASGWAFNAIRWCDRRRSFRVFYMNLVFFGPRSSFPNTVVFYIPVRFCFAPSLLGSVRVAFILMIPDGTTCSGRFQSFTGHDISPALWILPKITLVSHYALGLRLCLGFQAILAFCGHLNS
jgi:hypothetical protein